MGRAAKIAVEISWGIPGHLELPGLTQDARICIVKGREPAANCAPMPCRLECWSWQIAYPLITVVHCFNPKFLNVDVGCCELERSIAAPAERFN